PRGPLRRDRGAPRGPAVLHRLAPAPEPPGPALTFQSGQPDYAGTFRVRPAAAGAAVQVVTFVEVREGRFTFTANVLFPASPVPQTWTVRLRHWDGEVAVEPPGAARPAEGTGRGGARSWAVSGPGGEEGRTGVRLSGGVPLESAAEFAVPDVRVEEAAAAERYVVVAGGDLREAEAHGLAPVADGAGALGRWPTLAERLRRTARSAWRGPAGGRGPRLPAPP